MRDLVRAVVVSLIVAALLAAAPGRAGGMQQPGAQIVDHTVLDRILSERVRGERVDYLLVRKHDHGELVDYLEQMSRVDLRSLSVPDRLALLFNVYNASMIRAVVERFQADYSPADGDYRVFDEPLVRVGGRTLSLNELEHQILRREFSEPRLHVALVCAAVSCPPILARAYRGEDLDEVLERNMRRFLNDPARNRIDHAARRLELSRIFDWYAADFGGKQGVPAYVNRYTARDVSDYQVSFLDYSWELNLAPPATGRWVKVAPTGAPLTARPGGALIAELRRDEVVEVVGERDGWLRIARPSGELAWMTASAALPFP